MQVIHEHVEGALRELADEREQQRLWLSTGTAGAEVSSLDECVCRLFDDSGLGDELDRDRVVYTPGIDGRLTLLRKAMKRIDSKRDPQAVVDDSRMAEVRNLAAEILTLMNDLRYRPDAP
jgi:hypothetical protein